MFGSSLIQPLLFCHVATWPLISQGVHWPSTMQSLACGRHRFYRLLLCTSIAIYISFTPASLHDSVGVMDGRTVHDKNRFRRWPGTVGHGSGSAQGVFFRYGRTNLRRGFRYAPACAVG
ncbi:hypothetical protein GE09DRAFT_1138020 [Coniochaeta sp. 2T2.1]|nr:hypothetical protein GE09DRAFT_1138020 [Coniochaeta sp. 2T2.1]